MGFPTNVSALPDQCVASTYWLCAGSWGVRVNWVKFLPVYTQASRGKKGVHKPPWVTVVYIKDNKAIDTLEDLSKPTVI